MIRVLRRLAWSIAVVWAVTTVAFFVNDVIPSDPARMAAGPQARAADVERVRVQLGLDRPLTERYARFLHRLVHLEARGEAAAPDHATCAALGPVHVDLGRSYQQRRPVTTILAERLPRTLALAAGATLVQWLFALVGGVTAARRKGTVADAGIVLATLVGVSAPTFVTGLLLQYVLARRLKLLPLDGFGQTTAEQLTSLVLPALTLGLFGAAYATRLVRDEMTVLLRQDFVRTARAKGVPSWLLAWKHALRNALIPIVTVAALDSGALVGGAIVTEALFRWPGLGALSVSAMLDRDGPVILGTVLLTSSAIVFANALADLAYAALDPRVRIER